MNCEHATIYHLVAETEFGSQVKDGCYHPRYLAETGFVHCALGPSVIPVANDFFSQLSEKLLLLEIDPALLSCETRYEQAAPVGGCGSTHLAGATQFPHVYGPIEIAAIRSAGVMVRSSGGYQWPEVFESVGGFLR